MFCTTNSVIRAVARKRLRTEAIGPWFSSQVLRVFMMTIKNKSERNDRANCLGGLLLATALVMEFLVDIE